MISLPNHVTISADWAISWKEEFLPLVSPDEQNLLDRIEFAMKLEILQEEVKDFVISPASNATRASEYAKGKENHAIVKQDKNKQIKRETKPQSKPKN